MSAEKTRLEHHISALDTIERENEYLRTQIIALTRDYEENTMSREQEREQIKQRNFDSRMTMEAALRKEIQTLDTNFKALAVSATGINRLFSFLSPYATPIPRSNP